MKSIKQILEPIPSRVGWIVGTVLVIGNIIVWWIATHMK